ncbi:hypothetical protein BHE74_00025956 [Ensete ventricosum]|nr:hypothetical protein BHE74_00025956 [Ensete ventricosum]
MLSRRCRLVPSPHVGRRFFSHIGRRNVFFPRSSRGEKKRPREALARSPHAPRNLHREKKRSREASTMSSKLILQPCRGFFSLRAKDRDCRGRATSDLQVLSFLLPLLPSPAVDIARQRAVMVKINRFRPIPNNNGVETAPIGGTTRCGRYSLVLQTLVLTRENIIQNIMTG